MLYYKKCGNPEGKLVLFIHGGFTDSSSFIKQCDILRDYQCVFVDLPGHGKSDFGQCYHFDYETAAHELIKLIELLSPCEKIYIISHSYGGLVAKLIMSEIPHKIKGIVIGSTNLKRTPLFYMYTSIIGCIYLWLVNNKRYKRDNISWQLVFDTQKSAWKQFAVNNTDRFDDIPCILLYAQYDVRDIQESMLIWKNILKNSKLIQLKNTGHNYFYDSYGKVNKIIEKFISDQENFT